MLMAMLNRLPNKMKKILIPLFLLTAGMLYASGVFAQSPDEMYLAGNASLKKGDYNKAVENLSMAITRDNADERLFIHRGDAFLKLDNPEQAIKDYNEANEINPGVADLSLARVYAMEGDAVKAVSCLKNHLESPFRIAEDSIKKDPAFNRIQESAEWQNLWQNEWYNDSEKSVADAKYYLRKTNLDQAISVLDEAARKDPNNTMVLLARANAFMKQANYGAAAGDYSAAISKDKMLTEAYAGRGKANIYMRRFKEAVSDFNRVLKDDPSAFDAYLKRAEANAGLSNWDAAVRDMQVYLKYFDDDLHAIYICGGYYYSSGDYMNALKCFNRNLKEDPNNAQYFKARGMTYLKTNTYKYAASDLSMSLDLNAEDSEAWMYHGLAAIKTGDVQNGCSSLRRAQSMGNTEAVKYVLDNCQ
jgi:tetratricopeptide (TPR) repeat protein